MQTPSSVIEALCYDLDARANTLREYVYERMEAMGPVRSPEHIVGTYLVASRSHTVAETGGEIAYHMTSGVRHPPADTLLAQCTGEVFAQEAFDPSGRMGLVWVGFPVRMMQSAEGKVYTTDLLHLLAGEGVFGLTDHADVQLTRVEIPEAVLATFPGPAYGAQGIREKASWPDGLPFFGTILKPTSGITAEEVGRLVAAIAANPLFGFAKEDENLLPHLPFCPLLERTRAARTAMERSAGERGGRGLLFAPHITAPPDQLMTFLDAALKAGANAVMFSDQFVGGTLRMVREATASLPDPPAIYAHNGGISCRTRSIWREVLDLMVRLDGADFRQTAPVTTGPPLLRPNGLEWTQCERALTAPLGHIKPVMVARAGGLDQGNIILNLRDAAARGLGDGVLYLAGSAINSIKDSSGRPSPELGSAAMLQALEAYETGRVTGDDPAAHVEELRAYAASHHKDALLAALAQRYG
ncbi:MAG TPA: RuBisCO large subunit C-terminal-like domain-containing protein [Armatimonadota bacterium]|nr:RuBisCO large subunit C-terminal-like domain-containing protein [Armatimonadota bacterium]